MLNHPLSAGLESTASSTGATSMQAGASATSTHPQHQFPSGYDYPHHSQQQQQQQQQYPHQEPMRPHLDSYYSSQQQYATPHQYYASHHPVQSSQSHVHTQYSSSLPSSALSSSMSLKRKMPGATSVGSSSSHHSSASTSPASMSFAQDKLCDLCYHPDPILFSSVCGHLFHSRCVHVWPLEKCPVCDVDLPLVSVLKIEMNAQIDTRSGKWTRAEEKFIDCILTEFDRNSFPLANGTPVRLVLAKLLNCSTMRLSKKFQKNALGKRTFRIAKPAKGETALEFNRNDHLVRQKEFSRLEAIFRHELVEQYRRENNTDEGAYVETQDLRHAVKQFWVINFLKLAVMIGQPVQGLDISDAKKKKQALLMLRNGQFDELLSWNSSPVNTPTISPMPHMNAENTQWNGGSYGSHAPSIDMSATSSGGHHHQPVKKMRTPEGMARVPASCDIDVAHFEIQPTPPMATPVPAYEYGKTSPHSYAAQHHHYAAPGGYSRSVGSVPYGHYPSVKQEKVEAPHHHHHQQYGHVGGAAAPGSYSDDRHAGLATHSGQSYRGGHAITHHGGSYQSSSENAGSHHPHAQGGGQQYPWDELLDDISEPNAQVVDPALQAWSNLHIM